MKQHTSIASFISVLLTMSLLFGCAMGSSGGTSSDNGSSSTSSAFTIDIAGAQALALGASPDATANLVDARSVDASSVTNDALLKVMVDGTIENALTTENGSSTPPIQFLAVDPDGNIYVSFESRFADSRIGLFYLDVASGVLTAINAEGFGSDSWNVVKNWYWDNSLSRTKPIVFGPDSSAYFVLNEYTGSWGMDRVFRWTPGSSDVARPQTPGIDGMEISRVQVDSSGRMYAYGQLNGLNYAQFLQVFDPSATRGAYAFYSDTNQGWVRGYTVFGDRVYINGWGLYGGIDGIAEASTSVVNDAVEITPRALYASDANDWFNPVYNTRIQGGEEIHEGLFTYDSGQGAYVWADYWKDASGNLEGDRVRAYVSRFFVEDVALRDGYSWNGEIAGTTDVSAETFTYSALNSNPDSMQWLRDHIGQAADATQPATLFKDWRTANGFDWLNFSNVMDMLVIDQELWGIYDDGQGNPTALLRLVDRNRARALTAVKTRSAVGTDVRSDMFQVSQGRIYYRYKGERPGTHRIASIDTAGTVRDITANVTDIQYMTIYDYSIGPETIYFTGFDGIDTIAGAIDLTDLSYRRLSSDRLLSGIEVIR